jgi:hypothetical protein
MAHVSSWRVVLLLIDRGAVWKDEKSFGTPMAQMVAWEMETRGYGGKEIPAALQKLGSLYAQ